MSEEGYKNIIKTYEIETNQLYQDISNLEDRIEEAIKFMKEFNEIVLPYGDDIKTLILKNEYKKIISILERGKE